MEPRRYYHLSVALQWPSVPFSRLYGQIAGWVAERRIRGILGGSHTNLESAADAQTSSARRRMGVAPCQAGRDPQHLEEGRRTIAPVHRGRGPCPPHRRGVGGPARAARQAQLALSPLPALVPAGHLGRAVRER